jgi:Ni,Fe-hydrogenase III small subunit
MGNGTVKIAEHALRLLASLPDEVKLVLLGSEAISGGAYGKNYGVVGPMVKADSNSKSELKLPPGRKIEAYIAGSPPDPQSIIDAILKICEN